MAFDHSGRFLAIGSVSGEIRVFDCKAKIQSHSYKVHRGSVTKVLFHPNMHKL